MNRPTVHVIYYMSNLNGNAHQEHGVGRVATVTGHRPTWHDCRAHIPGFVVGEYLGLAPDQKDAR